MDFDALDKMITPSLRLGYVTDLFYKATGRKPPRQLDLLNDWFPGLIVAVEESDGRTKTAPEYKDTERMIHAVKYHDHLYGAESTRVTHIVGKLVGTSRSNLEKERKAAELIQMNIARRLVNEMDPILDLNTHVEQILDGLSEEETDQFHYMLYMFVLMTADEYYKTDPYDRDNELFPFDEEVFDQVMYNAMYQLSIYDFDGLVHGFLWLLLGSLLRNACGRVNRMFDSSFLPMYPEKSEDGGLRGRLTYLLASKEFDAYYAGDDLDKRFPGIEWFCDGCGAHLNEQAGFDDHLPAWQCRRCGYINPISFEEIYDSEEDRKNGIHRQTREQFDKAIEERKKELEES
ncbi:MAG: hypothetical protein IKD69_10480 [Solobacterium sp.]|nr:hypothetical protein [Solobacterium sp.]